MTLEYLEARENKHRRWAHRRGSGTSVEGRDDVKGCSDSGAVTHNICNRLVHLHHPLFGGSIQAGAVVELPLQTPLQVEQRPVLVALHNEECQHNSLDHELKSPCSTCMPLLLFSSHAARGSASTRAGCAAARSGMLDHH